MVLHRFLLVFGSLALLVGVGLTLVLLRAPPRSTGPALAVAPSQALLVAARPLRAGSLLRLGDLRWREVEPRAVLAGAFRRGQAAEADLVGAALRRDLEPGDQLTAAVVVKPDEAGFLAAALGPGKRAMSIAVDMVAANSGLLAPEDRVDVLLGQSFALPGANLGSRSAVETVLRNLRVIAVDQTITPGQGPGETSPLRPPNPHIPRTVTLEVSAAQAQQLMLAGQLGKLQLTLRGLSDERDGGRIRSKPPPSWAADVSSAVRAMDPSFRGLPGSPLQSDGAAPVAEPAAGTAVARMGRDRATLDLIRGSKIEQRCFDLSTRVSIDCSVPEALPTPTAPPAPPPARKAATAAAPAS